MPQLSSHAFTDSALPLEERVDDLIALFTLDEKVSWLSADGPAIPRLGLPAVNWGGECLHGLCHSGLATVFPQAIGLAATFNPKLVQRVAGAISDEARVKYHDPTWHGPNGPQGGLTFWTPNINIFRDPRWGRGQETYGEDPYLTGTIGVAFVRGLQGDDAHYLKVMACAKHFVVHSGPEALRSRFDARVTTHDLHETYLPAFHALVDAGVASVMGTYNRVNGEACCGSKTLLAGLLREEWGFDGLVTSDAGAIAAMHTQHHVTKNARESALLALRMGCDMEIASHCYQELAGAVRDGELDEALIDRSLRRILRVLFRLGMFEDQEQVPYAQISSRMLHALPHQDLAREAAQQSLVLLKNNGVLPIAPEQRRIFVTGPNAADIDILLGNFYRGVSTTLHTVLEGMVECAPPGSCVTYLKGCHLEHANAYPSDWAVGMAKTADIVVAVLGYSPLMEGEEGECIAATAGGDRDEITLPENQLLFLRELKALGKPLVAVVSGGSPIDLTEVHELADAVLFIWYPGEQGGCAVGDVLFGRVSPSGRLPVTFVKSLEQVPPFADYAMTERTYRYLTEEPLYPFGFGLSYSTFSYGPLQIMPSPVSLGDIMRVKVTVTNTGPVAAAEIAQLYLTNDSAPAPVPRWSLQGTQRVLLRPGESKTLRFPITPEMLALIDAQGVAVQQPGEFTVIIGGSSPDPRSVALGAAPPSVGHFTLE